jgi:hypothetical protein
MEIHEYVKDRKSRVILYIQMTMISAVSWTYQVMVLFMAVINTNLYR